MFTDESLVIAGRNGVKSP